MAPTMIPESAPQTFIPFQFKHNRIAGPNPAHAYPTNPRLASFGVKDNKTALLFPPSGPLFIYLVQRWIKQIIRLLIFGHNIHDFVINLGPKGEIQMDFFHGQETLTTIQWVLRAVVGYFIMIITAKLMGQRSISQLILLDFSIAVVIGNIIAHPLSDERLGLKGSMISMSVLVILYVSSVLIVLKSKYLRKFVLPNPLPLVKNGQFVYKNLTKARISVDYILSEARKEKIDDLKKISLALWEPDGTISFFISPNHQPVSRDDLKIVTEPFDLPKIVVREGNIEKSVLQQAGKEESWLRSSLKTNHNVVLGDVLLATIDKSNQLKVFLYDKKTADYSRF